MNKKLSTKELQQQINKLTEALQRERADAINLRRRTEEDRAGMGDYYKAAIIRDILPIIDNSERLLDHISAHSKEAPWKEGAEKIVQQSYKVLADLGVERIKTVGEHFDPHLHEAVSMDLPSDLPAETLVEGGALAKEGDGGGQHEIISKELQPGYKLGTEVIRPAMVKVKKEKK